MLQINVMGKSLKHQQECKRQSQVAIQIDNYYSITKHLSPLLGRPQRTSQRHLGSAGLSLRLEPLYSHKSQRPRRRNHRKPRFQLVMPRNESCSRSIYLRRKPCACTRTLNIYAEHALNVYNTHTLCSN